MEEWLIDNILDFLDEIMEHPLDDDLKTKVRYKIRDLEELKEDLENKRKALNNISWRY